MSSIGRNIFKLPLNDEEIIIEEEEDMDWAIGLGKTLNQNFKAIQARMGRSVDFGTKAAFDYMRGMRVAFKGAVPDGFLTPNRDLQKSS